MDGLLIDSEPLWREAMISIFNQLGVPMTWEMALQTMGLRMDEVIAYWQRKYPWRDRTIEEVNADILAEVDRLVWEKGGTMPGVEKTIAFFHKQGIPMALASSSPMSLITSFVKKMGIADDLTVMRSGMQEEYGKPHPSVFINTAKAMGVLPEECLVFEDSFYGLVAAKAAKMTAIGVPEAELKDQPRFQVADVLLDSLTDFSEEVFEQLNK
ncbi:2-deoxyglucose-6-phosphatase [Persicobacter psychrovividus]|uniref:2-deoxyglucose-6-phosphatase n=2 Tax=Persicobacter psychrovividus TaxID=387638 RepID=A0ABM7VGB7_9BACT|nr:2-deoxyglucose-6-phosphatase [Persicobacter psychrovividus]